MFRRILVANRGEIAVRIARTAHRLGIDAVGVYSDPDRNAVHTDAMDLAVSLGGSRPAESYLRSDAIIEAALRTGADAVHPGYGFLAENAAFARAVADAGLVWIGPTPEQIELLGDKIAAKRTAVEAGVPTMAVIEVAPGAVPDEVDMPVLVKAAAGGGGRGMRVVTDRADLASAVASASREAESAFGDGTVFLEPWISRGRHIEVQIIGDTRGNVVHLGERECSIQRRNQKVVEEAPSAGISGEVRSLVCDGALKLARRVGYVNAGTVEFLVAEDGAVNFLEVNTRLQVEHPVTEAVTGLDLVELQFRVAAGEALPIDQDDVTIDGHAIEVRLVAEDPAAGWIPSTGLVTGFAIGDGVRVDSGVRAGSEVSPDYDSLLAKVIAHAPDRTSAAGRLRRALRASEITGVGTNLPTLVSILGEADYLSADTPTAYLAEHPEVELATGAVGDDRLALLLAAAFANERRNRLADTVTGFAPSGWRNLRTRGHREIWSQNGEQHHLEYTIDGGRASVLVGAWPEPAEDGSLPDDDRRVVDVGLLRRSDSAQVLSLDGVRHAVSTRVDGETVHTTGSLGSASWSLVPRFVVPDLEQAGSGPICPLPGTVIAVEVEVGQSVSDGDLLMVIEAMKMEHRITAHGDAVVEGIRFAVGDRVDAGDLLIQLSHPG